MSFNGEKAWHLQDHCELPENWVTGISAVAADEVWVATCQRGAAHVRGGEVRRLGKPEGLPDERLTAVSAGKHGASVARTRATPLPCRDTRCRCQVGHHHRNIRYGYLPPVPELAARVAAPASGRAVNKQSTSMPLPDRYPHRSGKTRHRHRHGGINVRAVAELAVVSLAPALDPSIRQHRTGVVTAGGDGRGRAFRRAMGLGFLRFADPVAARKTQRGVWLAPGGTSEAAAGETQSRRNLSGARSRHHGTEIAVNGVTNVPQEWSTVDAEGPESVSISPPAIRSVPRRRLGAGEKQLGDGPDFRAAKMGLSPSEIGKLFLARSLTA